MTRELYHHGILGQKWGVRRFQNEDGSLTAEGRKRYGSHIENVKKEDLLDQMNRNFTSGKSKSQKEVQKRWTKAEKMADNSKAGKELTKVNNYMKQLGSNVLYTEQFVNEYNRLGQEYLKVATDYMNQPKFRDEVASMIINELGYDDTEIGRKYVLELMGEFRYRQ